jgi:hypothetical protein
MRKISLPTRQEIDSIIWSGADKTELFGFVYDAVEALELAHEFLDAVKCYEKETYERARDAYDEQQAGV